MAVFGFFKKGFDPDTYEKELTQLTVSMLTTQQQVLRLRQRARAVRRLLVQYLVMIYAIVTAYNWMQLPRDAHGKNWIEKYVRGLLRRQLAVALLFPVGSYLLVRLVHWLFAVVVGRRQAYLKRLEKQHLAKIDELKRITNFNTTSSLLKKFGEPEDRGVALGAAKGAPGGPGRQGMQQRGPGARGFPATANVPRNPAEEKIRRELNLDVEVEPIGGAPGAHQDQLLPPGSPGSTRSRSGSGLAPPGGPARTASPAPSLQWQLQHQLAEKQKSRLWGDRFLDVLVGSEHNELVENRYALICANCYAHNGLAPPGCQNPLAVKFVCMKCGAFNGDLLDGAPVQGGHLRNPSDHHSIASVGDDKTHEEKEAVTEGN